MNNELLVHDYDHRIWATDLNVGHEFIELQCCGS
jgi:hypothetical protein